MKKLAIVVVGALALACGAALANDIKAPKAGVEMKDAEMDNVTAGGTVLPATAAAGQLLNGVAHSAKSAVTTIPTASTGLVGPAGNLLNGVVDSAKAIAAPALAPALNAQHGLLHHF